MEGGRTPGEAASRTRSSLRVGRPGFGRNALERSEDHAGPHIIFGWWRGLTGPSRARRETGKAEEGAGKANDPQLRAHGRYRTDEAIRRSVSDLEDPANLRELPGFARAASERPKPLKGRHESQFRPQGFGPA